MSITSILARLQKIWSFIGVSRSLGQCLPLALLGWARSNPSSIIHRPFPTVAVKPSILRGGRVTVSSRDLGQLVSFEEIFVQHTYDLSLVPFVPKQILDCGGHVGYFTAIAGAAYPQAKLAIFEPNPANLPWLKSNIAGLRNRVLLHEVAVSNYDGTCRFDAEISSGGHLNEGCDSGLEVTVKDLTKWLSASADAPLLLKIDVEGEEKRLLPHVVAQLPQQCFIFFETHDGAAPREHLVTLLKEAGFHVTQLRERGDYTDLFAVRCAS